MFRPRIVIDFGYDDTSATLRSIPQIDSTSRTCDEADREFYFGADCLVPDGKETQSV